MLYKATHDVSIEKINFLIKRNEHNVLNIYSIGHLVITNSWNDHQLLHSLQNSPSFSIPHMMIFHFFLVKPDKKNTF